MRRRRAWGIATLTFTVSACVAIATSIGACSSSSDAAAPVAQDAGSTTDEASVDSGNGAPSTQYPAPHPNVPQILSFGGPVITAPHVIPVFFPDDAYEPQIETYLQQLAASSYWSTATTEYGVGPLSIGASIVLASAPPAAITSADVDTLVKQIATGAAAVATPDGGVDAGPLPTPDGNTVYAVFYPTATIISEAPGYDSCKAFGGYHGDETITGSDSNPLQFTYALVPRCPNFYASEGLTGVDEVTAGLSHELVEAVTDPFSETKAAYLAADDDHKVWSVVLAASETGDMCSWEDPSAVKPSGVDFKTSRIWSNAAAKAGHDPCVPAPSDPYFASIPDLSEEVSIPEYVAYGADGKPTLGGTTKGILLQVGESKTIDLVLYSDGPTSGPWTVTPQEISTSPTLSFSLDRNSGVNGERLHLTVTRTAKSAAHHGSSFIIYSSIGPATLSSRMSLSMVYVAD